LISSLRIDINLPVLRFQNRQAPVLANVHRHPGASHAEASEPDCATAERGHTQTPIPISK